MVFAAAAALAAPPPPPPLERLRATLLPLAPTAETRNSVVRSLYRFSVSRQMRQYRKHMTCGAHVCVCVFACLLDAVDAREVRVM